MIPPRFSITYMVNGAVTSTLENLPASEVYSNAVPGEAILPIPGSRWHVRMLLSTMEWMATSRANDSMTVAYQTQSPTPGLDFEEIIVHRSS